MTGRLRFLHLTTFYPPYSFGGDATYLYRLCHALADEGHDVDVVHSVDAYHLLHPAAPEIAFAPHPGVTVHALDTGHRILTPLITHQTGSPGLNASAIRRLMASKAYDVVHYHNISLLGPRVLEYPTASRRTIKLYTTHEHWLICPTHVLWKFNERACERPQCLQCTVAAGRPPQWWRYAGVLEASARHVDRFVSPSRFTAAMHHDRGFSEPVGHLPYFVDRSDDDWKAPGNSPHPRPYFLFVGRLERIKGLQTILPLWDSIPEYDLVIAGTGTMESDLRERAAGNPRVHFLGPQSQRALGRLYAHAVACDRSFAHLRDLRDRDPRIVRAAHAGHRPPTRCASRGGRGERRRPDVRIRRRVRCGSTAYRRVSDRAVVRSATQDTMRSCGIGRATRT